MDQERTIYAKLETMKDVRFKTISLEKLKMKIVREVVEKGEETMKSLNSQLTLLLILGGKRGCRGKMSGRVSAGDGTAVAGEDESCGGAQADPCRYKCDGKRNKTGRGEQIEGP